MSELLIHPAAGAAQDPIVAVTPESAGWEYVGFEVRRLGPGESFALGRDRLERCLVAVEGSFDVRVEAAELTGVGGRRTPFDGLPGAVYAPAGSECELVAAGDGDAEVAICAAPGGGDHGPYSISPEEIAVEVRGTGAMERRVHPIVMGDRPAHSLLVVEVITPAGHWSSYPPHKHDEDAPPRETRLEEIYYHRVMPAEGFGMQRVYSADGELDESLTFGDRDLVLVPRGYHAIAMQPGYDGYYLNVMAGPLREWRMTDDPAHGWLRTW